MPSEHRLHPFSIVFTIGSSARRLLLPGLVVLLAARNTDLDVYLMALFLPYAVAAMLRYLTLRYAFGSDELVIRSGLMFRNVRHIPYARIHNIGVVQNLLHRMLKVAEVRVETAAGGGQHAEARLQVLDLQATEEMRRRVGERKARGAAAAGSGSRETAAIGAGGLTSGDVPAPRVEDEAARTSGTVTGETAGGGTVPPGEVLLRMPVRELLLYGVIENRGLVVVAAVWGFLWQLSWQLGWMSGRDLFVSDAIIGPIARAFDRAGLVAGLLLTMLLVVVFFLSLRVVSVGWALVKLHGFTLRHHDGALSTTCGLLTRVSTAIPARRIQVLTVREGPLHRLFGRVELRADIVGGSPEESSATHERLGPLVRAAEALPLVRRIEPGLDLQRVSWSPVHPRAWRRLLARHTLLAVVAVGVLAANLGWQVLALLPLLAPLLWVMSVRQARALGYSVSGDGVFFRSGWLWRRTSGARLDKVQTISLVESPFDRRRGMAGLHVDNAGLSHGSHRLHIPYLEAATARRLLDELEARAARSAFRL